MAALITPDHLRPGASAAAAWRKTLAHLPGGSARVESAVARPASEAWFCRSARLVQLLHLALPSLQRGSPLRTSHEGP